MAPTNDKRHLSYSSVEATEKAHLFRMARPASSTSSNAPLAAVPEVESAADEQRSSASKQSAATSTRASTNEPTSQPMVYRRQLFISATAPPTRPSAKAPTSQHVPDTRSLSPSTPSATSNPLVYRLTGSAETKGYLKSQWMVDMEKRQRCYSIQLATDKSTLVRLAEVKPQTVPSFQLPLELREQIYEEALLPKRTWSSQGMQLIGKNVVNPALLLANKQFSAEYENISKKHVTCIVNDTPYYSPNGAALPIPRALRCALAIEINIRLPCYDSYRGLLRGLLGAMTEAKEKKVKAFMKPAGPTAEYRDEKKCGPVQILRAVRCLRGVGLEIWEYKKGAAEWYFGAKHVLKMVMDEKTGVLVQVEEGGQ